MAHGSTERIEITEIDGDRVRRRTDDLIVEESLAIRLDGTTVTTTMRTPGHDEELAVGFCHTDGLLGGFPVVSVQAGVTATWSAAVDVSTGGVAPIPTPRLGNTASSCGWCGSELLDRLCERLDPLPPTPMIPPMVLRDVPARVRADQGLFGATGAVHAAASFSPDGEVLLVREDVGRHNALDKVIGALLLAGELPATGLGVFVSGRASVEMIQKAWSAGFGTLVAVSAPTALAVSTARRAGLVLAGFVRGDRLNVYAPEPLPS